MRGKAEQRIYPGKGNVPFLYFFYNILFGVVWSGVWTCMHVNVLTHTHMHTCMEMTAPLI